MFWTIALIIFLAFMWLANMMMWLVYLAEMKRQGDELRQIRNFLENVPIWEK